MHAALCLQLLKGTCQVPPTYVDPWLPRLLLLTVSVCPSASQSQFCRDHYALGFLIRKGPQALMMRGWNSTTCISARRVMQKPRRRPSSSGSLCWDPHPASCQQRSLRSPQGEGKAGVCLWELPPAQTHSCWLTSTAGAGHLPHLGWSCRISGATGHREGTTAGKKGDCLPREDRGERGQARGSMVPSVDGNLRRNHFHVGAIAGAGAGAGASSPKGPSFQRDKHWDTEQRRSAVV